MMWGWYPGGWNWGFMAGRMVLGVLFWVGLIWFAIRFLRGGQRSSYMPHAGGDDAMVILRRRLANGEISTDDYERLKATLSRPE